MERSDERVTILEILEEITCLAGFFWFYRTKSSRAIGKATTNLWSTYGSSAMNPRVIRRSSSVPNAWMWQLPSPRYSVSEIHSGHRLFDSGEGRTHRSSLIEEDMEMLELDPMVEITQVILPSRGDSHGSLITYELEPSDFATWLVPNWHFFVMAAHTQSC